LTTTEAVLFDLDNTLILFRESDFYREYTSRLYLRFADLLSAEAFGERMMASTRRMVRNDGSASNLDVFLDAFSDGLDLDPYLIWQRFDAFYTQEFEQFRHLMDPLPGAREVVTGLQERGLRLVIATNPMFPLVVQEIRLRWAGLDDVRFELITSVENSRFCKPHLGYFTEICEALRLDPSACLMVGNDPFNDMIASRTGMRTYLTTDAHAASIEVSQQLNEGDPQEEPVPDGTGPLADLVAFVDEADR
jgi:FMN phosphatase YigB (HAD superfamily)